MYEIGGKGRLGDGESGERIRAVVKETRVHGDGGTDDDGHRVLRQLQEARHGFIRKGCARHKDEILPRDDILGGLGGIISVVWILLEDGELADGRPFLFEIWEMPDDGDLLPANALPVECERFEFAPLGERLGVLVLVVEPAQCSDFLRTVDPRVDCRSCDGCLVSVPRHDAFRRLAQRTPDKALVAHMRARVAADRHGDAGKAAGADERPRDADRVVVDADVIRDICEDFVVEMPIVQEKHALSAEVFISLSG